MDLDKVKELFNTTSDFLGKSNLENLIVDNKIEFPIGNEIFRVKRPSFLDKQEVLKQRNKKFLDLLNDKSVLLQKDLIKTYEDRGISIKEIDDKYEILKSKKNDYDKKLGQAITENKPVEELEIYKKEIEKIKEDQRDLLFEKSTLLEFSIESQVEIFMHLYLAYVITEKKIEDNWVRAWETYEEFLKQKESVVNTVVWYAGLVAHNELVGA